MIEAKGLTKYYGTQAAVDDVSFIARPGEVLGFLGPNGAGKTTTMRMLTCYLPPSRGTARVAGFDILDDSMAVRSRIGYLPENVPLYRDLNVDAYLDFVGRLKGMDSADRARRCDQIAPECGITEVWRKPISTLSRGYRQRVGIAQALINDPEVLILDEPTVGLDPRQIVEIRELIRRLAGDRTIILSTHILPEVSLLCQRVLIINRGRLITDDTPENLGRHLLRSVIVEVEIQGDGESARRALGSVDGVDHVEIVGDPGNGKLSITTASGSDPREDIARALVGAGLGLRSLVCRELSLEDIFVELVTEENTDG